MYEIDLGLLNSGKIVSENTTNFLLSRAHDPRNEKKIKMLEIILAIEALLFVY